MSSNISSEASAIYPSIYRFSSQTLLLCSLLLLSVSYPAAPHGSLLYQVARRSSVHFAESREVRFKHVHLLHQRRECSFCGLSHFLVHSFSLQDRISTKVCYNVPFQDKQHEVYDNCIILESCTHSEMIVTVHFKCHIKAMDHATMYVL